MLLGFGSPHSHVANIPQRPDRILSNDILRPLTNVTAMASECHNSIQVHPVLNRASKSSPYHSACCKRSRAHPDSGILQYHKGTPPSSDMGNGYKLSRNPAQRYPLRHRYRNRWLPQDLVPHGIANDRNMASFHIAIR